MNGARLASVAHAAGRAAASPHALRAGIAINALAAGVAAGAANWPVMRDHLPAHWWLLGAAGLAVANVLIHSAVHRQQVP
jgi:large exoprotein involved in heme utilization and adhesion